MGPNPRRDAVTQEFLIRVAIAAAFYLAIAICGIMLLLRAQRRQQEYRARVTTVITRPTQIVPIGSSLLTMTTRPVGNIRFVQWLTKAPRRRPDEMVKMWIVLAIGIAAAAALASFLSDFLGYFALPILVVLPVMLTRFVFNWGDERLANAYRRQFPEALAIIARTVRVGVPVAEALRIVARETEDPTAAEFGYVVNRINIGIPLGEALHSSAERTGLTEHRLFATAVSLQTQTGGGLTETLTGLAATIRKRITARERARAMASEARTTAYILGGLPIVTGGLLGAVNPTYVGVLFTDHTGNVILLIATSSLLMGFSVMRMIIQKSLS
jgi:tight adherence protein B